MAENITDTDRLNFLESEANKKGGLLLHDGSECGRRGLGLRPGAVNRTLRQAIDAAMRGALPGPANAAPTDPVPSLESAVKLPLYQAAQWNIAVQCAERKPHGPIVLDGRTVLAVHTKLTASVAECRPDLTHCERCKRRVEAAIEKLQRCSLGCWPFGQCKAAMHGTPSECAAGVAGGGHQGEGR